jgi:hypothetical protein
MLDLLQLISGRDSTIQRPNSRASDAKNNPRAK